MESKPPRVLGLVFLTVFLDMVGFSVIFPLFPSMLTWYVEREGEASLIGRLVESLSNLAGTEFAVVTLFGGVLGSLYSVLQFVAAPLWGSLSDRIGRRPTLLVTLAGTTLSYVVWFFAGSFWILIVARLLGGVAAGNISTASAVIADTHEGPERAKGMGAMGAGIGLGFVVGPALGGLFSSVDLSADWSAGAALGVNPFSAAAAAAFVLALINFAWAALRFPETRRPGTASASAGRTLNPLGALRAIDQPGVRATNLAYFLYFTAFGAMEFTLTFLAAERLDYGPRDNMWMFVFVGLVIAFVQGGLVRRLVPRLGERRVAVTGLVLTLPGFVIVGAAHSAGTLYAGLGFLSFGSALVMPSLSSLVSRYSPEERQGLALGVFRSLGSLARAIAPLVGGILFWSVSSAAPYYGGAAFLVLPLFLALSLPPVPASGAEVDG